MNQQNPQQQISIFGKIASDVEKRLRAIGAQFAIVMPDGTKYGELEIVPPKKRVQKVKRGSWLPIYAPVIDGMKVSDVVTFNPLEAGVDLADRDSFRASILSYARRKWGNGNYESIFNQQTGCIELICMAIDPAAKPEA
jgi:hypothetical protein